MTMATTMRTMFTTLHETAIGPLRILVDEAGRLRQIDFHGARDGPAGAAESRERCANVATQLDEYFAGTRERFDLELVLDGTEFQCAIWRELQRIPFGATISYAELARRVGRPKAVRAAGSANGANRIPIVIPCHRVVSSDGTLGGFGGGLDVKRALLELEGRPALR